MDSTGTNVIATGYVHGIGIGPQVGFGPGLQSTVSSGLRYPRGVAVDVRGNVYIADQENSTVVKVPRTGSGYGTQSSSQEAQQ